MALKRMDNVGIVVDDLAATIDFFRELGLDLEGQATIEGEWAGRVTGLGDQRVEVAMMRTPDGHGRLELSRFLTPPAMRYYAAAAVAWTHIDWSPRVQFCSVSEHKLAKVASWSPDSSSGAGRSGGRRDSDRRRVPEDGPPRLPRQDDANQHVGIDGVSSGACWCITAHALRYFTLTSIVELEPACVAEP
jgi:catechol 2,3-dioxygenase-like lactoylglutathione lyase family enzyme